MKARPVSGLKPRRPLAEASARIVAARLDELLGHAFAALDPEATKAQHDMRIAAKRLRYVLEAIGFPLGEAGERGRAAARALQEVLGDLHDCDEMASRAGAHLERLRAGDVAVVAGAADDEGDVRAEHAAYAPNRNAYRGLEVLIVYVEAQKAVLFERFASLWAAQLDEGVWDRLREAAEALLERRRPG